MSWSRGLALPPRIGSCDACSKPFHQSCLSEWLRALPTTQQSFNRLFGECPYCSASIAVNALPG